MATAAAMRLAILCGMLCPALQAQTAPVSASILDHLAGDWVLEGTIAGKPAMHDIEATWMLNHEYLRLHEISRDKNAEGRAAYEAIVLLGWDPKAKKYDCLWLDTTAGGGLSGEGIGRGSQQGDSIPFIFVLSASESIHTTFAYDDRQDTWRWTIDDETNGKLDRFADVRLVKAK
jgi:hypothetical protein